MEQDLNVEAQEALQASLPFVQLIHLEDGYSLQQVVVVVELLVGSDVAVEHALALQVMQLTVQLNWLEDYDRPAEKEKEVLLAE